MRFISPAVFVIDGKNLEPTKMNRRLSLAASVRPPVVGKTQTVKWFPPGDPGSSSSIDTAQGGGIV